MKTKFFILSIVFLQSVTAQPSLLYVRQLYKQAAEEETSCLELVSTLENYTELNNPVMAGYKACGTMMMAHYVFNPFEKLAHFNTGKTLLEKCILQEPDNVELRFLRFTVQHEAPSFLNYNQQLENDKYFLLRSVRIVNDMQLRRIIVSFLSNSSKLNAAEKQNLPL